MSWLVINPNFSCGMLSFVVALGFCEGDGDFEKVGLVAMILGSVLYTVILAQPYTAWRLRRLSKIEIALKLSPLHNGSPCPDRERSLQLIGQRGGSLRFHVPQRLADEESDIRSEVGVSRDVSICACLCGLICAKKTKFIQQSFIKMKIWAIDKHENDYRPTFIIKENMK